MLKTFATVIKIEMSNLDFIFYFRPRGGVWVAPVDELLYKKAIYFYGHEIKLSELIKDDSASSITVDNNRGYVKVDTFEELYTQNMSFMFYEDDSIKYIAIHFDNFSTPFTKNRIILNTALFFCDRSFRENGSVIKINNKKVEERIQEINSADIEGNALNFETLMTNEMSVTLLNHDGLFDNFDKLYGNTFQVIQVFDDDVKKDIEKNKIVYSGYIQKPEYNYLDTITIMAGDIRYTFSSTLPSHTFNLRDYPHLAKFPENVKSGEEIIDSVRTLAAGRGIILQLTPVKYDAVSDIPEVVFEICDTSLYPIENIVSVADILDYNKIKPHVWFIEKGQKDESVENNGTTITGDIEIIIDEYKDFDDGNGLQKAWSIDKVKGTITFTGDSQVKSITDRSDNLYEIFIEVDIPPYNSLEFVRLCLDYFENISFIKQNYDMENWITSELLSREIAIILNDNNSKDLLDVIGEVCFMNRGRLEIVNNKITFNSTNNREVKYKFKQSKMGRVDKTVDDSEYLSAVSIIYDQAKYTYKNTNYEDIAKSRHRLNASEEYTTLLKNKVDAMVLSEEIMDARYYLKDHITFEYFETLDKLELFDLVEFEYKRDDKNYYIKPCICEILKLNVFDNVIKLRKVSDV